MSKSSAARQVGGEESSASRLAVRPEQAQHALPWAGLICRSVYEFKSPDGQPQVLSLSCSWSNPQQRQARNNAVRLLLRALEQADCTVTRAYRLHETFIEIGEREPAW